MQPERLVLPAQQVRPEILVPLDLLVLKAIPVLRVLREELVILDQPDLKVPQAPVFLQRTKQPISVHLLNVGEMDISTVESIQVVMPMPVEPISQMVR